jgi:hypothetical protein
MKKFILMAVACLFCISMQAQNIQSPLMIVISPEESVIRLDTALFKQTNKHIMTDSGSYVIRAWAPKKKLLIDTIHVDGRNPVLYRKKLENSDAYKAYKKDLNSYYRKALLTKYVPAMLTIGSAIYFTSRYRYQENQAEGHLDKCKEYKAQYELATDNDKIEQYRKGFYSEKEQYDAAVEKANNTIKQATIVIPVGLVATGVLLYISRDLKKPVYTETPLLSGLNFNYEWFGQTPGPRINYSFKF